MCVKATRVQTNCRFFWIWIAALTAEDDLRDGVQAWVPERFCTIDVKAGRGAISVAIIVRFSLVSSNPKLGCRRQPAVKKLHCNALFALF
jgi:hypothetical protein